MSPLVKKKFSIRRWFSKILMRVAPEWKLRQDLRKYDEETREVLRRMRAEKKPKEEVEATEDERRLLREESSGLLWQHQSEKLLAEARKLGLYPREVYKDGDPFERNNFGAQFLKSTRELETAVRAEKNEREKERRERWTFRFGLIVGMISILKEAVPVVLPAIKTAIIDVIKALKG